MTDITVTTLANGLTLVVEPMAFARSASMVWRLPAGAAGDPSDRVGESAMLSEFVFRGAAGMSSREHSDALDRAGVRRDSGVGTHHLTLSASLVGSRLDQALPLLTAAVRSPTLAEDAIEPCRSLCLQTIESLRDEPQHYAILALREHHMPAPFNRHGYGDADHVRSINIDHLREAWRRRCVPGGSIVGVAGEVDPDRIERQLEELLDGWTGSAEDVQQQAPPDRGLTHLHEETAQVHIGVAYDAPKEADEHSMLERLAVNVLSGGMSGRLFTEVRERRSLCYSVNASYAAGRDRGQVSLYAGTTPERAQETLDVCLGEIRRMREGVSDEEFRRAVVGLKSRLVMQGESSTARASALTRDQFRLGRPRSLDEIAEAVEAITREALNAYLAERDFGELTVVSLGPTPLELKDAPVETT